MTDRLSGPPACFRNATFSLPFIPDDVLPGAAIHHAVPASPLEPDEFRVASQDEVGPSAAAPVEPLAEVAVPGAILAWVAPRNAARSLAAELVFAPVLAPALTGPAVRALVARGGPAPGGIASRGFAVSPVGALAVRFWCDKPERVSAPDDLPVRGVPLSLVRCDSVAAQDGFVSGRVFPVDFDMWERVFAGCDLAALWAAQYLVGSQQDDFRWTGSAFPGAIAGRAVALQVFDSWSLMVLRRLMWMAGRGWR